MASTVFQFISNESYKKAAPYMREVVAFALTMGVVDNVVKGVFGTFKDTQKTYMTTLTTLIGTGVVFSALRPFSNNDLQYLTIAWLITGIVGIVKFVYKEKLVQRTSKSSPLPNKAIEKPASLPLPNSIIHFLSQVKAGESTLFASSDGWDVNFLSWALEQKAELKDYNVDYFAGKTKGEVDELQARIHKNPQWMIITTDPLPKPLRLPKETYCVGYFSPGIVENQIPLPLLSKEETVNLFKAWVKKPARVLFEEESLQVIYEFAQRDKSKSFYSWMYLLLNSFGELKVGITTVNNGADQLNVYSRESKCTSTALIDTAAYLKSNFGLDIAFHPQKEVKVPYFLTPIKQEESSEGRHEQAQQVMSALGGEETPHAMVIGFNHRELESVLSMPLFQKLNVVKMDGVLFQQDAKSNIERLLEYLWAHPTSLLYIPSIQTMLLNTDLRRILLKKIPSQTWILGQVNRREDLSSLGRPLHLQAEDTQDFKGVCLMPLTQKQCLAELKPWARKYSFEEKSLEIAACLAFLLHKENGAEFTFTKDLIERAAKNTTVPITPLDIWKVFIPLYHLHMEQKKQEHSLLQGEEGKSLLRIAMTLKKKYAVVLPVKEVPLSEPPKFLTDLNEKVKDLKEFAVPISERVGALRKAFLGKYKNALILAPSGAGKTTLVKWAAWMSATQRFEPTHPLYGKTIYTLNLTAVLADTKYIGTLERRIEILFNFLMQSKDAVLFIDEIHLLMGAGVSRGNKMGSVAQQMKTYLEESGIGVIGATTESEYEKFVKKDGAFVRRFNHFTLGDPSNEDAIKIFEHHVASDEFKDLKSPVDISPANLQFVLETIKSTKSNISLIDRGIKLLEQIAKNAETSNATIITEAFIKQAADELE